MNIIKLIRSNEELKELPFLVVFRTIRILCDLGLVNLEAFSDGVESSQS